MDRTVKHVEYTTILMLFILNGICLFLKVSPVGDLHEEKGGRLVPTSNGCC